MVYWTIRFCNFRCLGTSLYSWYITYRFNSSFDFTVGTTLGCTDTTSNYDDYANTDDGSCIYPCTDNEMALNMYDSYGDGWNGSTYSITDLLMVFVVATGGLLSGSYDSDTLCLPTGCYDITVGGGSWTSEVSFDFGSLVGQVLEHTLIFLLVEQLVLFLVVLIQQPANYDPTSYY